MKGDMSFICNKYIRDYQFAMKSCFGWEEEDLRQHFRILLWKGVATFNESLGFKITSYLSTILYRGVSNLNKGCKTHKAQLAQMVLSGDGLDEVESGEFAESVGSSEDWMNYSQQFSVLMGDIGRDEMRVLTAHLIHGNDLSQMQKKFKMKRTDIVRIIKSIQIKMENHFGG